MKKTGQTEAKKQVSFYIPLEVYKEVKMKSLQEEVPMNSLLLNAIFLLLKKNPQQSRDKKLSGKDFLEFIKPMQFSGGDPDLSKKIDEIVYS